MSPQTHEFERLVLTEDLAILEKWVQNQIKNTMKIF